MSIHQLVVAVHQKSQQVPNLKVVGCPREEPRKLQRSERKSHSGIGRRVEADRPRVQEESTEATGRTAHRL